MKLISFRETEIDDAKLILDWRTSERVTKLMNSDVPYDIEGQKNWLSSSFNKPNYYHWIIQHDGKDVGLLKFVDWDQNQKITSWGFYIGEDSSLGIGGLVPPYFYNFAFDYLGVNMVRAELTFDNINTIKLHLLQGYQFDPSRDHVITKNGNSILMVCMNLEKKTFKKSRFIRLKKELPIDNWQGNPIKK